MPVTNCTYIQISEIRERRIKTKSHYKMTCGCCGETIHRGDEITQVLGNAGQMRTRDFHVNAAGESIYSYAPTRNRWVHLHCRPSYWYTYGWSPMFCAGFTRYSNSIERRRDAAAIDPDWGENYWEIPNPVWKLEQERIEKGVVATFQGLWRGYSTRKKYKAVKWIIAKCSTYVKSVICWSSAFKWLPRVAAAVQIQRIWRGYNIRSKRTGVVHEMPHYPIGTRVSIIFDKTTRHERPWTGRIISRVDKAPECVLTSWNGLGYIPRWYLVKFDVDGEFRMYHHNHLEMLIDEAKEWKKDRNWTRARDGKRLDYWYWCKDTIFRKLFPSTGSILGHQNINQLQWLDFCKPYKPIAHPNIFGLTARLHPRFVQAVVGGQVLDGAIVH